VGVGIAGKHMQLLADLLARKGNKMAVVRRKVFLVEILLVFRFVVYFRNSYVEIAVGG
jgi:hypothetical protein